MTLNWKIRIKKDWSAYHGNNSGDLRDDFDKVAEKLGLTKDQCYEQITNIRVKKILYWAGDVFDRIKFIYLVETKDKSIEVEGYHHGSSGDLGSNWVFNDDYMLKMRGFHGSYGGETCVKFLEFRSVYPSNGDIWTGWKGTGEGTEFKELVPACFFSRSSGRYLGSIACYRGELYNADLEKLQKDNIEAFEKVKEAHKKQKQAETDRDTAQTSLKSWTDIFGTKKPNEVKTEIDNLINNQCKHKPEDLKPADYDQIKGELKTANEELSKWLNAFPVDKYPKGIQDVKDSIQFLNDAKDLLQKDLNKWTAIFPKDKYPNGADDVSKTIINLEGSKTTLDALTTYWNDNISKDYELPAFNLGALKELKNRLTSLSQTSQVNHTAWQQNGFDKLFGDKIDKDSLKKIKDELDKLNNQLTQAGNGSALGTQYLNKLLEIYKNQIKQETEIFYLNEIDLDESDYIRPKYGTDYLTLLDKLTGDSEPRQVINAFKVVALIGLIDKAKKESGEYIDFDTGNVKNPIAKKPVFKNNKLKTFNRIKEIWEIKTADIEQQGEIKADKVNNPLYLDIITSKNTYKSQIEKIIKLWQEL